MAQIDTEIVRGGTSFGEFLREGGAHFWEQYGGTAVFTAEITSAVLGIAYAYWRGDIRNANLLMDVGTGLAIGTGGLLAGYCVSVITSPARLLKIERHRIATLEKRSKPLLKITLEAKLEALHSLYYFRGHIRNEGDSVEGLRVRLTGLADGLASALARGDVASTAAMDLAWKSGSVGPMDIDHGREETFTIASVVPNDPPEFLFNGMEAGKGTFTRVGPGKHSFDLHITGYKMDEIIRQVEVELEPRFHNKCVKIIRG